MVGHVKFPSFSFPFFPSFFFSSPVSFSALEHLLTLNIYIYIDTTSSTTSTKMENPFAGLRPEMRSEHDEIRKGIFSRALRNMQTSPLEERREWCRAIRATHTAAQAAKQKRAAAAAATQASASPAPPSSSASLSPAVGTKRTHDETERLGTSATGEGAAAKKAVKGEAGTHPPSSADPSPTASTTAAAAPGGGGGAVDVEKAEENAEAEESEAAVKECIAAYLRSLLDRVVGVSLENLNVPALRILCMMVGIKTEVRNKIALYSTLASFYYTECEKLGKRVSRDTVYERQVEQEVAMLRHAAPSATASAKRSTDKKEVATPSANEKSSARADARGQGNAAPTAVVGSVTSKRAADATAVKPERKKKAAANASVAAAPAKSHQTSQPAKTVGAGVVHCRKYDNLGDDEQAEEEERLSAPEEGSPASLDHARTNDQKSGRQSQPYSAVNHVYASNDDDGDEGEVVYEDRVFARPGNSGLSAATVNSMYMAKYASSSSASEEGWTTAKLERKIASIVQADDPVTVAVIVKKLAQIGYRDANATHVVDQVLHRFQSRQLILYDNGIAYLSG